jgi:D-3-phosphoglycerate dehydrogenase / 2-oxoglutarate reductase
MPGKRLDFLFIAKQQRIQRMWVPVFVEAVNKLGNLRIVENGNDLSTEEVAGLIRQCDVLLTGWEAVAVPEAIAGNPGKLSYICCVTGTVRALVPKELIAAGIPLTNWGDAQARSVAEGAFTLLLATIKNLRKRIDVIGSGGWSPQGIAGFRSDVLALMDVGIYGCGVIGRCFIEMLKPFGPRIRIFDPFASDLPDGVSKVDSLEDLFTRSNIVAIHCGLTPETRGSVSANLLAMLPDHGILINTARGEIVDQQALFGELESGRLRAGIDTLYEKPETDPALPANHPARQLKNLILTAHCLNSPHPTPDKLLQMHEICLQNLNSFIEKKPLSFLMDQQRYDRST